MEEDAVKLRNGISIDAFINEEEKKRFQNNTEISIREKLCPYILRATLTKKQKGYEIRGICCQDSEECRYNPISDDYQKCEIPTKAKEQIGDLITYAKFCMGK